VCQQQLLVVAEILKFFQESTAFLAKNENCTTNATNNVQQTNTIKREPSFNMASMNSQMNRKKLS